MSIISSVDIITHVALCDEEHLKESTELIKQAVVNLNDHGIDDSDIINVFTKIITNYLGNFLHFDYLNGLGDSLESVQSDKYLYKLFSYMNPDWKISLHRGTIKMAHWDVDLLAVLCGTKKIALIDNDCLMDPDDPTDDIDYKLRHICSIYGMERVTTYKNNDPANLYYFPKNWKHVAILYKYHSGDCKLPSYPNFKKQEVFDMFQGILLGYDVTSIIFYIRQYKFLSNTFDDVKNEWDVLRKTIEKESKKYVKLGNKMKVYIARQMESLTDMDKMFFRGIDILP
jgi:hypothetical protein